MLARPGFNKLRKHHIHFIQVQPSTRGSTYLLFPLIVAVSFSRFSFSTMLFGLHERALRTCRDFHGSSMESLFAWAVWKLQLGCLSSLKFYGSKFCSFTRKVSV